MGAGWRRKPPEQSSAAASSPELAVRPLQGLVWVEVWCKRTSSAWVVHWGTQGRGSGLGRGSSTARAARRPRSSPELGAWAPRARQGLRDLAQRDQGARAVLTEARIEQCRRAGAPALMEGLGLGWVVLGLGFFSIPSSLLFLNSNKV